MPFAPPPAPCWWDYPPGPERLAALKSKLDTSDPAHRFDESGSPTPPIRTRYASLSALPAIPRRPRGRPRKPPP